MRISEAKISADSVDPPLANKRELSLDSGRGVDRLPTVLATGSSQTSIYPYSLEGTAYHVSIDILEDSATNTSKERP